MLTDGLQPDCRPLRKNLDSASPRDKTITLRKQNAQLQRALVQLQRPVLRLQHLVLWLRRAAPQPDHPRAQ